MYSGDECYGDEITSGLSGIPHGWTVNNMLRGDDGPGHFPEDVDSPNFEVCSRCSCEYEVTEGCVNCNPRQFRGRFSSDFEDEPYERGQEIDYD